MKNKFFANFVFAVFLIISTVIIGYSQTCPPLTAGCLDNTFAINGWMATSVPSASNFSFQGAEVQSDGKILALNSVSGSSFSGVIIRYNANGSVDTSFGSGGYLYLYWRGINDTGGDPFGIAIQRVGTEERIVVAGSGTGYPTLHVDRYLPDGSPDASFGIGGSVVINAARARAVACQPDGKILTVGNGGDLVRLNFNGTLDTSFGNGGVVTISQYTISPQRLALQSNGRILVGGFTTNVQGNYVMAVSRFNPDGSLDGGAKSDTTKGDSFGKSGTATIEFSGQAGVFDIKIDGSGKILVAGFATLGNMDFAVARLTNAGALDSTFGSGGKTTINFSGFDDKASSIKLQSNGKIVLSGSVYTSSTNRNAGFARLNANGSLDTTFGQGGKVISDFSSEDEQGIYGMIQLDPVCGCEKIVGVGEAKFGGVSQAIAARYLP